MLLFIKFQFNKSSNINIKLKSTSQIFRLIYLCYCLWHEMWLNVFLCDELTFNAGRGPLSKCKWLSLRWYMLTFNSQSLKSHGKFNVKYYFILQVITMWKEVLPMSIMWLCHKSRDCWLFFMQNKLIMNSFWIGRYRRRNFSKECFFFEIEISSPNKASWSSLVWNFHTSKYRRL